MVIQTDLTRTPKGLSIQFRVNPAIEEFMKTLSGELDIQASGLYGRYWVPPTVDDILPVYGLPTTEGVSGLIRSGSLAGGYRLDRPGGQMTYQGDYGTVINMSFLRMVGASSPEGKRFTVVGVYSKDSIVEMKQLIAEAAANFYRNFLRPVHVVLEISTKDILPKQEGVDGEATRTAN